MMWWLSAAGWTCVAITQVVVLSIALNVSRSAVLAVFQAVIPHAAVINFVFGLFFVATGDVTLAVACLIQVVWVVCIIARPLIRHRRDRPTASADGKATFLVAHANVLYLNPSPTQAARDLLASDADIIALTELTSDIHEALLGHEHAARWPHRHVVFGPGTDGIGVWSKHSFTHVEERRLVSKAALLTQVQTDDERHIHVLVVHPMPPMNRVKTRDWAPSLHAIGDVAMSTNAPMIVIGDFNTAFWHAPLRRLFHRGLRSAHLIHGKFLSATFPVGRWRRPVVRLDHALVNDTLAVHAVRDFTVTGSDHLGIVVTVSTRAHATN